MAYNKLLTLVFVRNEARVLLGYKKRGFGMGRWNGFGGKVEKGETIVEGAIRELNEESGLVTTKSDLNCLGVLLFEFTGNKEILEVHVFTTYTYSGVITETSEMLPKWYDIEDIPFDKMWPDDKYWFPLMLQDKKFKGDFLFQGMDTILKQHIEEISDS